MGGTMHQPGVRRATQHDARARHHGRRPHTPFPHRVFASAHRPVSRSYLCLVFEPSSYSSPGQAGFACGAQQGHGGAWASCTESTRKVTHEWTTAVPRRYTGVGFDSSSGHVVTRRGGTPIVSRKDDKCSIEHAASLQSGRHVAHSFVHTREHASVPPSLSISYRPDVRILVPMGNLRRRVNALEGEVQE